MKRYLSFVLSLLLIFSLAACGSTGNYSSFGNNKGNDSKYGFDSVEELLEAYEACFNCTATKETFQRTYPKAMWESGEMDYTLDTLWGDYQAWIERTMENNASSFGDDWKLTMELTSIEDVTIPVDDLTEEDREDWRKMYGAEPEECFFYEIEFTCTIAGSLNEYITNRSMPVTKIAGKWYLD